MNVFRFILAAAVALPVLLPAQESVPLPRCTTGRVVQVALPGTACSAVSEKWHLAAFGHRGATDNQLTLVPLDSAGLPGAGPARRVSLPKPESLKAFTLSALDVAFHPALPLLYVWLDVAYPFAPKGAAANPVFADFDHLAVYAVGTGTLALAGTFARGSDYAYGFELGRIALDPAGRRLFVPNLRRAEERGGIGYLPLTSNGMPLVGEDLKAKLASVDLSDVAEVTTGKGMACFNERVVCVGVPHGLATWDTGNRLGAVSVLRLFDWPDSAVFVGSHPAVPAIYMAVRDTIGMVQAADGYPTLLPRQRAVPGGGFTCAPVVLPGAPAAVAFGGTNAVYLMGIDPATGFFTGADSVVVVTNPTVRGLSASAPWNRLYLPVEALP